MKSSVPVFNPLLVDHKNVGFEYPVHWGYVWIISPKEIISYLSLIKVIMNITKTSIIIITHYYLFKKNDDYTRIIVYFFRTISNVFIQVYHTTFISTIIAPNHRIGWWENWNQKHQFDGNKQNNPLNGGFMWCQIRLLEYYIIPDPPYMEYVPTFTPNLAQFCR